MSRSRFHIAIILWAWVLLLPPGAGAQVASGMFDAEVVATAGEQTVSFGEVVRSFALAPLAEAGQTWYEAYRLQLQHVIGEKLLARQAQAQRLHELPEAAAYLQFLEDKEVIRELYRQHVLAQIVLTKEEEELAYELARRRVRLDYIRTTDSLRAEAYAAVWAAEGFDRLNVSPEDERGTTNWIRLDEITPELEAVVFGMKEGEVRVAREDDSWYALKLVQGEVDVFASEWDFAQRRSKLRHDLTERRARPLAAAFVADVMADQQVRLDRAGFVALGNALAAWLADPQNLQPVLEELPAATQHLPMTGDEVVVRYRDGQMTAREVLDELSYLPTSLIRPGLLLAGQLRDAIAVLVRNRVLARHGRGLGLDTLAQVRREVHYHADQYLASRWRQAERAAIEIPQEEITAFRNGEAYAALRIHRKADLTDDEVREVLVRYTLAQMEAEVLEELAQRYPVAVYEEVLRKKIHDPEAVLAQAPAPLLLREVFQ